MTDAVISDEDFDALIDGVLGTLDGQRFDVGMNAIFASIHYMLEDAPPEVQRYVLNDVEHFLRVMREHCTPTAQVTH